MKSPAELDTQELVAQPQPSEQPGKPVRRNRTLIFAAVVVTLIAVILAGALLSRKPTKATLRSSHSAAHSGGIQDVIRITGTTEAVHMRAIIAPPLSGQQFGTLTVTKVVVGGTKVHKGDVVAEFDRQSQMQTFIDQQASYRDLANQVLQEQAKEDAARAKDETEVRQAESDLNKAQLEMQKIELLSRIDAEKAQQTLDEAKANLQQLRETFDLKRQTARASIHLLEIQRDRAREVMEHARANAELMEIHSPIDGVVVLNSIWKQGRMGQVQEGDQVRAGMTFMQVVDPSKMQVRAFVNQEDFLNLQFGDTAKIHLDAYPDMAFPGKLEEMAPIARSGDYSSKLRTFTVVFSIDGSDPKLMPDLSAAVDVQLTSQAARAGAFQ
jgi:HlyD family secretion protein